jgi:hypothetical protein
MKTVLSLTVTFLLLMCPVATNANDSTHSIKSFTKSGVSRTDSAPFKCQLCNYFVFVPPTMIFEIANEYQVLIVTAVTSFKASDKNAISVDELTICYRQNGQTNTLIAPNSSEPLFFKVGAGAVMPVSVTSRFTGLAAGSYEVGLCYMYATGGNDNGDVSPDLTYGSHLIAIVHE